MATKDKKKEKAEKKEKADDNKIVLTPKDKSYPGWKPSPPS